MDQEKTGLATLLNSVPDTLTSSNNTSINIENEKKEIEMDIESDIESDINLNCEDEFKISSNNKSINDKTIINKVIQKGDDKELDKLLTDHNFFRAMLIQDIPENYNANELYKLFSEFGEIEYVIKICFYILIKNINIINDIKIVMET